MIGAKTFRIRFNKIGGFIRVYDGTRYLTMFGSEKYDAIYNGIRYLIGVKKKVSYMFFVTIMRKSKFILLIITCL